MAYSLDFRQRVFAYKEKHQLTFEQTSEHFGKASATKRAAFVSRIEAYEAQGKEVIYLDESGFAQDMPRNYGYSDIGTRCYGTQDWHAKGRLNARARA